MPIPLGGLVSIAEYGSKFESDVAANLLVAQGIQATTSYDPALNTVATYFASDRTVDVVVLPADVERASAILRDAGADLPGAFTAPEVVTWQADTVARRPGRTALIRTVAIVLMAAVIVVPLLATLLSILRS